MATTRPAPPGCAWARGALLGLSMAFVVGCRSPGGAVTPVTLGNDASVDQASTLPRVAKDASAVGSFDGGADAGLDAEVDATSTTPPTPVEPAEAAAPPHEGMAVPRGSHGKCVAAWFNCACAYECRWETPGEMPRADCANVCGQPAPRIRCAVRDGWCGPTGK